EEVERHERRWRRGGQLLHPRSGGMQAQLKEIEVETAGADDHDLAVDDTALREMLDEGWSELGEVAIQRTQGAALRVHTIVIPEDQRAEPVPLRLEQPTRSFGEAVRHLRQHRLDRRVDWEPGRGLGGVRRRSSGPRHPVRPGGIMKGYRGEGKVGSLLA